MFSILLTQNTTPILGWCARMLSYIMRALYAGFDMLGIENIGLCIIVFTLLIKIVLFPMTLNQQKFSKLSSLMNPEIQAVQKKYQGKRDNESMLKMQKETQAIYDKYGTSPTGSCSTMLIQMPILFSLYYIVNNIPAYVPAVQDYFTPVSSIICEDYSNLEYLDYIIDKDDNIKCSNLDSVVNDLEKTEGKNKKIIDVLAKYSNQQWNNLEKTYENMDDIVSKFDDYSDKDWDKIEKEYKGKDKKEFAKFVDTLQEENKVSDLVSTFKESYSVIVDSKKDIMNIYNFGPINLSQTPYSMLGWAILIPLLSYLTQWYSAKLSFANNPIDADSPMASSMKMMTTIMPLFSMFLAFTVPAGLGLYWAASGAFQVIQQIILNNYFKKVDVNDIIKKNVEKQKKKKKKSGYMEKLLAEAANTNTKSISNNVKVDTNKDSVNKKGKIKSGSMAEKANMVKDFNERNK